MLFPYGSIWTAIMSESLDTSSWCAHPYQFKIIPERVRVWLGHVVSQLQLIIIANQNKASTITCLCMVVASRQFAQQKKLICRKLASSKLWGVKRGSMRIVIDDKGLRWGPFNPLLWIAVPFGIAKCWQTHLVVAQMQDNRASETQTDRSHVGDNNGIDPRFLCYNGDPKSQE